MLPLIYIILTIGLHFYFTAYKLNEILFIQNFKFFVRILSLKINLLLRVDYEVSILHTIFIGILKRTCITVEFWLLHTIL